MKTQIKATTYKDIPTDLNEDMSYINFEEGKKHFTENELKWFVRFHNMKRDLLDASQVEEYKNYLKMMAIMALGKRYELKFEIDMKTTSMFGYYEHFRSSKKGVKIVICPKTFNNYSYEGRESSHQKVLSTIRHEMCHWYLHTTGEEKYKDGDKEFEELLLRVNSDSSHTESVAESKEVQKSIIEGTYKKSTAQHDVKFKRVDVYKTYSSSHEKVDKLYEVIDNKTGEVIGGVARASWGNFVPLHDKLFENHKHGGDFKRLHRGYDTRVVALKVMMNFISK